MARTTVPKTERLEVRVSRAEMAKLRRIAKNDDVSVGEVVRRAVAALPDVRKPVDYTKLSERAEGVLMPRCSTGCFNDTCLFAKGHEMIRFIDMTNDYWLFPEGKLGPFAFIDTITDTFVTVAGEQLWDDAEHFEEACTRAQKFGIREHCAEREALHERLRGLIHPRFRVVSSTEKEPAHDEEPGELVERSEGRDEER